MDDPPLLFDTSIYNVAPPRISDYEDGTYDPYWEQMERRRYRQLDENPLFKGGKDRQLDEVHQQLDGEGSDRTFEDNGNKGLLGDIRITPSSQGKDLETSESNETLKLTRRKRGCGTGSIHWRTITRNGKDYSQAWYHWEKDGRKRSKYIPKALLGDIQKAEAAKRPVTEVLRLLEGKATPSKKALLGNAEITPSNTEQQRISPSNETLKLTRRVKGDGSGSLHWKTITKNGKDYPQAWYHYEFWKNGKCLVKSSKYIPKRLIIKIQEIEAEKVPVTEILDLLGVIYW